MTIRLSARGDQAVAAAEARAREADAAALKVALIREAGAVRRVAEQLGVSKDTIYRRLDEYGLRSWLDATYPLSGRQPARDRAPKKKSAVA
jgi:transcriptional regulator of acetoin/glycerol metabolism